MLKQRILISIILFVFILLCLFILPKNYAFLVLVIISSLAAWEWANLIKSLNRVGRMLYTSAIVISFILFLLLATPTTQLIGIEVGVVWWLLVMGLLILCVYRQRLLPSSSRMQPAFQAASGFFTLLPCGIALNFLYNHSPWYILFLLVLIPSSDIGAYFVGHWYGRHKLAKIISPGKTIEGLLGGIVLAVFIAVIWTHSVQMMHNTGLVILLAVTVTLFGVTGDLFESLQKRLCGVKDSGWLLPGHGGILDRIDSITASAPVFSLVLYLMRLTTNY